jgi:hypothetical protein
MHSALILAGLIQGRADAPATRFERGFSFARLSATSIISHMEIRMKNGSKRRAWTSVQVRELKTMARKKTPAGRIAKKLKRTEGATRQKAFSLGLSLDSR